MAAKLDIEYIEIRNFLSYGDYVTRLEVANLGPVLILGSAGPEDDSSNGAGKSSLLSAFVWCLFGRTITNPNPGDRVTNWFTKKNCYVKIKTADGWEVIRTRNFDGHSELILRKDGDDETQSTNTNAQTKLKELFGLDYEIFTSSVFCGQFGKSFLEMSPVKRKETIERLLGLDRLNKYADTAKGQSKQIENRQEVTRTKIDVLKADSNRQEERLITNTKSKNQFEDDRQARLDQIQLKLQEVRLEISKTYLPDADKLTKQWKVANSILEKVSQYRDKIKANQLKAELLAGEISRSDECYADFGGWPYDVPNLDELEKKHKEADKASEEIATYSKVILQVHGQYQCAAQDVNRLQRQIEGWENKSNTDCESCGQEICAEHVEKSIASVSEELARAIRIRDNHQSAHDRLCKGRLELEAIEKPNMSLEEAKRLDELNKSIAEDVEAIGEQQDAMENERVELLAQNEKTKLVVQQIIDKLEAVKPKITLEEAARIQAVHDSLEKRESDLSDRSGEILIETNPYSTIITGLLDVTKELKEEIDEYNNEIGQLDVLFKHYRYIHRSYSDRRKIKSWLLSELIPFLNDRVQYYLDMLDIEMTIKFSSTLSTETDRWGYEFCSGGERKRIDLAIMFGLYDLYMSIYGQQCNIMVLDEVDSRLDKRGVESFTEIVHDICTNDERPRPSTIFVISHKQELESLFSSQITIKKENNFSSIDQTVFSSD
jgi:DNA repair exonuclease SbcCD ATPase subunit